MIKQMKIAFRFTALSTVGLGMLYPLATAVVGFLIPSSPPLSFPKTDSQNDTLFQARPSLSGGAYSGASNLALTSQELHKQVRERLSRLTAGVPGVPVPRDLLFASASGYDPHISVEGALFQVSRIAKARNIEGKELEKLVKQHTQPKIWGFIGADKVNVVELNEGLK